MDTPETSQEVKFVWRRLEDMVQIGGKEFDPAVFWPMALTAVLVVAFVYVVLMYRRDSRGVGWKWAVFLGTIRSVVYGVLGCVFLLPALEKWERVEQPSKVLLLHDVSRSMHTRDDVPTENTPLTQLPTRLDKVVAFFEDGKFIADLHEQNPTTLYRFGGGGDDAGWPVAKGEPVPSDQLREWLYLKEPLEAGLTGDKLAEAKKKQEELHARLLGSTNYGESLARVTNREFNNLVQALIIFGDGRNTQGSDQAMRDLRARAAKANIPIITVAVGENRPQRSILITDLQTPDQARPDDKFPVRVEVDGQGFPNHDTAVTLEITSPSGKKFTDKRDFKFDQGGNAPPHAQIEFEMDIVKYGTVLENKKPELEEGQWKFLAKVPRAKGEIYADPVHVSKEQIVQVIKKPLRVLLFADAATRDFQFLRTLFVREVDQRRADLSICLQTQRPGLVMDVPQDQLLKHFPTRLGGDAPEKPEERYYNLARYDLIVAFDPDWTQLTPEQLNILEQWVRLHAGGLVLIAGPIHTTKMARPGPIREQLRQLLDLYPVYLKDSTLLNLGASERGNTIPHRLLFGNVTPDMDFLKLDDEGKDLLAGWEEFFTGKPKPEPGAKVENGFYSYYPARSLKPSAIAVANFGDPRADTLEDGKPQPFLVTMPYGGGKVVYLSSGETFRLRTHRETYHERFWTKLGRYAGAGTLSRLSKHGVIVMSREFTAGQMVRMEAQLFGRDMQPLAANLSPKLELKPPAGVTMPMSVPLRAKPSAGAEWNGWFQGAFRVMQPGDYRLELSVPETGDVLQGKFTVKESDPEMDNTQPDFSYLYQLAGSLTEVDGRLDATAQRNLDDTLRATAAKHLGLSDSTGADTAKGREALRLFFDLDSAHLIPSFIKSDSRTHRNKGRMEDLWDKGWIIDAKELQEFVRVTRMAALALGLLLVVCTGIVWLFDKPLRRWILTAAIVFLVQVPIWVVTRLPTDWVLPSGRAADGSIVPIAGPADERVLILAFVLLGVVALLSLEWMTRKLLKLA